MSFCDINFCQCLQDRGDINELVSKEDYEEILNRKIQQMKKKNEELLQKHLVCSCIEVALMFVWAAISVAP